MSGPIDIEALKAVAEKAGQRLPWTANYSDDDPNRWFVIEGDPDPENGAEGFDVCELSNMNREAKAAFIAAANPTVVLSLIARTEAAEGEATEARDALEDLRIEYGHAQREARDLAVWLHKNYYADVTDWKPFSDASGLLTQIDNMVAGVRDRLAKAEGSAREHFAAAQHNAKACSELRDLAGQQKQRADNHLQTLKSIREFAHQGDCERIVLWVNDAIPGYIETAEQTLGHWIDRATAAEARTAELVAQRDGLVEENETLRSSEAWAIGLLNAAEDTLRLISAQAVCVGMDGPEGDARMLKNVHDLAEAHLSLDRTALSTIKAGGGADE